MSRKKNRKRKSSTSSSAQTRSRSTFGGFGWILASVAIVSAYFYFSGERDTPEKNVEPPTVATDGDVPAFYRDHEAAKPFPALLPSTRYDHPVVSRAYAIAHEIPEVLVQQPCYCYCETVGHRSLLDCWASDHGAG